VERSLLEADRAEAAARMMLAANPSSVWGQYALAQVLADREDYRGVIAVLDPVVAGWEAGRGDSQGLNPVRVFEQLAVAHQGLRDYDRAVELFERARQATPGDVRLVRLAAAAFLEGGQPDRGVQLLEAFVEDNPRSAAAYVSLAEIYIQGGRMANALGIIDRAATRLPGDTSVAFGVGNALERDGHFVEAEQVFRALLAEDGNHVQTLNSFGYMLAVQGIRLEESIEYITRALEIEPDNPAIVDSLGWAYYKLNRLDLAEQHLRRAAAGLATNSVVQDHLGDTLFKQGNFTEAALAWERALAGDGDAIERAEVERKLEAARQRAANQ
jgi:tetratricopeptide (TPR) repeat protein